MFNFHDLGIKKDAYGSFVGIRQDNNDGKLYFYLPKGFNDFNPTYKNIKQLFFSVYKIFKKFVYNNCIDDMLDNKPQSKDNLYINSNSGYTFSDDNNNEVILYSKIDIIDNFFKVYQSLDMDILVQKVGLIEDIDYPKIDNLLRDGVFLKNHSIFVESNYGVKNIIDTALSDLVELYCYIYKELLNELKEDINPLVNEVAHNFSYRYLTEEQSLFDEYTFDSTISILKDRLNVIDKTTAYKDYIYWDIYDVVEDFLYGSLTLNENNNVDESFWGINQFSMIWEDMCNYMMSKDDKREILFCDSKLNLKRNNLKQEMFGGRAVWKNIDFENVFYVELEEKRRWMRPDMVTRDMPNNILEMLINEKILTVSRCGSKKVLLKNDRIDVIIKLNKKNDSIAQKIFNFFMYEIKKLKRIQGLTVRESGNIFHVCNIPEEKFNDIYDVIHSNVNIEIKYYIMDWKYVSWEIYENACNEKAEKDIIKQLTYEFCLKNKLDDYPIKNIFGVPYYLEGKTEPMVEHFSLSRGIFVYKINFLIAQELYLNG